MVGAQEPLPFGLVCPHHGGPEPVAWQPSGLRGHAGATLHQRCRDRSAGGCADWPYLCDRASVSHFPPAAEPRRRVGTPARGGWHAGPTGYQARRDTQPTAAVPARRYRPSRARQRTTPRPQQPPCSAEGRRRGRRGLLRQFHRGTARAPKVAGPRARGRPRRLRSHPSAAVPAQRRRVQRRTARGGRDTAVPKSPDTVLGCTWLGWETAWPGTSNTPRSSRRGGTP